MNVSETPFSTGIADLLKREFSVYLSIKKNANRVKYVFVKKRQGSIFAKTPAQVSVTNPIGSELFWRYEGNKKGRAKTDPGAYNLPLYLTYTPEDIYDIAALLRDNQHFVIESIYSREDGEQAVAVSTTRLHNIAGKYTGKDDPVMLVRVQGAFPATGEVLGPYTICPYVAGFMRGSHTGPLMPVKRHTGVSFFDGPPIVSCLVLKESEQSAIGVPGAFLGSRHRCKEGDRALFAGCQLRLPRPAK